MHAPFDLTYLLMGYLVNESKSFFAHEANLMSLNGVTWKQLHESADVISTII